MTKILLRTFVAITLLMSGYLYAQSPNDIVAVVNGKKITQAEIDESISGQLAPLQEQIAILRKAALDNYITRTILEQEAKKRGISVEALRKLLTETKVEISQSEVEKEYIANSSAFAQMSPDEARERLRLDMESYQRIRYFKTQLDRLRLSSKVEILIQPTQKARIKVDEDGPSKGSKDAKVTVVIFSDFQCPYCRQSFGIVNAVLAKYGDEIRLIYKHMPLDIHSGAFPAARASVCASEQGKFWEYHDLLFTTENFSEAGFLNIAEKLKLDSSKFKSWINSEGSKSQVVKDMQEAERLKLSGTPTFYINGRQVVGATSFDAFTKIIDEELQLGK